MTRPGTMPDAPPLHPDVEPFAFLLGTWQGAGRGAYPTIDGFDFGEELRFWHVGKPFLAYAQRTWILADGRPAHAEAGYWRGTAGGVELVLAHPTGITEIATGSVDGTTIELMSASLGATPTAKSVTALRRRYTVEGDTLRYDLWMAAVGEPLTHHLTGELTRTAS